GTAAMTGATGVDITVAAGERMECTFVNQRKGRIYTRVYHDQDVNGKPRREPYLPGWTVAVYQDGALRESLVTNSVGKANFNKYEEGEYTVCVTMQADWFNSQPGVVDPTVGDPCYTVTVGVAQIVRTDFGVHQFDGATGQSLAPAGPVSYPDPFVFPDEVDENVVYDTDIHRAGEDGILYVPWLVTR
ncbi:MAG: hypothetical protein KDD78_04800, partial [Caldilineaceae bacterium]|nr:hypothetical protein [Caldilineaceae bacterium]